jgi:hypothetical protein
MLMDWIGNSISEVAIDEGQSYVSGRMDERVVLLLVILNIL